MVTTGDMGKPSIFASAVGYRFPNSGLIDYMVIIGETSCAPFEYPI